MKIGDLVRYPSYNSAKIFKIKAKLAQIPAAFHLVSNDGDKVNAPEALIKPLIQKKSPYTKLPVRILAKMAKNGNSQALKELRNRLKRK
jgi:hypothetical protein